MAISHTRPRTPICGLWRRVFSEIPVGRLELGQGGVGRIVYGRFLARLCNLWYLADRIGGNKHDTRLSELLDNLLRLVLLGFMKVNRTTSKIDSCSVFVKFTR